MSLTGIVLAGGEASRMPNKLLLPTLDGGIIIESSLKFLKSLNVTRTIVVHGPSKVITTLLKHRGWNNALFVEQSKPTGVCDAIRLAMFPGINIIVFGDNIYDHNEDVVLTPGFASVRNIPWDNQLDKWVNTKFVPRDGKPGWCIAGWYIINNAMKPMKGEDHLDWANRCLKPQFVSLNNWRDIGTPEEYERYICYAGK